MNRIKYLYRDKNVYLSGVNPASSLKHNKTKSLSKYRKIKDPLKPCYNRRNDNYIDNLEKNRNFKENFQKIENLNDYENYLRNSLD
jgi:hypothetical protein